ncbi:hypothetical protein CYY_002850 [Polysphondylium violaceum]|uniref:Uncharacterized protein n=1 Tax=Polysphondylium violaceum TaxID=133409 RepID=A0A8J4Q116_9MYCE|nr:hypothetical protein CYY_002850 [Polysphondylium violaceum]
MNDFNNSDDINIKIKYDQLKDHTKQMNQLLKNLGDKIVRLQLDNREKDEKIKSNEKQLHLVTGERDQLCQTVDEIHEYIKPRLEILEAKIDSLQLENDTLKAENEKLILKLLQY